MPKCELSGKGPVSKNIVSHSNIKNKSRAYPNIQNKTFISKALNEKFSFKVATSTIRTIEHKGGFDRYMLWQDETILSKRAQKVWHKLNRKVRPKPAKQATVKNQEAAS